MNRQKIYRLLTSRALRFVGSQSSPQVNGGEQKLVSILKESFPKAVEINVADISGGCGAMYEIVIDSVEFKGKNRVQQHRMVTEALKEEIKDMHGLRILTNISQLD